jgi:itaconate CoA-transferase
MLPLEGITVVALEQAVAAPFATRQLADLGARVLKIERPGGGDFARHYDETVGGMSSYFVWLNRSKESLTLDIKHPVAREIIARLLATADVFVQNLAPGATDRIGLGADDLLSRHPSLIVCDISGYGKSGPYRDKKAYDLLVQCETGLVSVTGTPETPSKVGISIADIGAGMYAFSGILTALYQRERTGHGTSIEVSLFDTLTEWMGAPLYFTAYGGTAPPRTGATHATIAPYGPFETGDGKQVNLGIQNEREWRRFCGQVLAQSSLADDARFDSNSKRAAHREELHEAIHAIFCELTADEVVARLDRADIANAQMNSVEDLLAHPQLAERGRWRSVACPVGEVRAPLPAATLSGVDPRMGPVPAVGEQTDSILRSLGYDETTIAELREAEAI